MKVLVTGGGGFVGLNVVEALLGRGDDVVALGDAPFPDYARRVMAALPGRLAEARADVADADAVQGAVAAHRPECIVHAAVITAGEQRELRELDRVVDVNVKGTAHVLAAAAAHAVRRVVYVSSGSAYGGALTAGERVDEETPPRPDTLYSITKYSAERVCARFRTLRGLDVVALRLGSVFGPWERDTGVRDTLSLPLQIVRHAIAGERVVLPRREARRDWVYSRDVASGILAVMDARKLDRALYNLSSGAQWSGFAQAWCERVQQIFPRFEYRVAAEGETANVSFLGPQDRALMSIDRLRDDTGYRPAHATPRVHDDHADWIQAHRAYYER